MKAKLNTTVVLHVLKAVSMSTIVARDFVLYKHHFAPFLEATSIDSQ